MELFETFGEIFRPELKPTHRLCRYCDCFHEQVGDFCSKECEDNYKWEYEQEFYKQNREQDAEHTLWLLTQQTTEAPQEN